MLETIYQQRRARIASALKAAGGGVAVVSTAPERQRNSDSDHPYRYDSNFHYLTGFAEPHSVLVLTDQGRSLLFCRERNVEREIWEGVRLGPQEAPRELGVDEAFAIESLDHKLPELLADQPALWLPFGSRPDLGARVQRWLEVVRTRAREGVGCPSCVRDLNSLMGEMRLIKDDIELDVMRRACGISAGAHARAMRYCAQRFRTAPQNSVREYEIEAELLHEFRRHGAQSPAYPSIVAAGPNTCVLHYTAGRGELRAGELCLIDAGCELDGYASDITRTFPADGRFSSEQRVLYDIVLAAQTAAVATTRPGARKQDSHWAAVRVLAQGMLDVGLLDRDTHGDVDAVIDTAAYRQFYMHGTGHWLGLDVHDVGAYLALDETPVEQPDVRGGTVMRKPSRHLQPGMVVTLEPGLYVHPGQGVPEKFWHIGIRIEDDVLVTPEGCELLSRAVPVAPEEIEALMRNA
jgi:Xaa-Pro aminopeptidase